MSTATATYRRRDGSAFTVEYDPEGPCMVCGLPVVTASMGGTVVCPWCDTGTCRFCAARPVEPRGHLAASHPEHMPGPEGGA
jgi:hypothetical protein